jgi:glutathione peroxidase
MKSLIAMLSIFAMVTFENGESVYEFKLNSITGEEVNMADFEGKVLLIVNTASECGFTRQYEGLQKLHDKYKESDFLVLGFPANNFGGQEPGTNEEIQEFCQVNFGVDFPLFSKISVSGDDKHPFFEYLTSLKNGDFSGEIGWNFEKFLINRNGILVRRFKSNVEPESEEMTNAIEQEL